MITQIYHTRKEITVVQDKTKKYLAVHQDCVAEGITLEEALWKIKQIIIAKEFHRLMRYN